MRKLSLLYLLLLLPLVFSCKPRVPGKYIQPGKFENILYDYHLAEAMAENDEGYISSSYDAVLYRQAVLRKHGVTQAEFDSSLVYYTRHADRLYKIYDNLSKRLSDEALSLGVSANEINRYGGIKSAKDTSNLWRGEPSYVLVSDAPYNVMSFEIVADSTYHEGDKIIFSFKPSFISRDGQRDATALLAVEFKNDSVASGVTRVYSTSNCSVSVSDYDRKGIKSIRGFVYLGNKKQGLRDNGARVMCIHDISLVRLRNAATSERRPQEPSSLATPDTMLRSDAPAVNKSSEPIKMKDVAPSRLIEPDAKPATEIKPIASPSQKLSGK